MASEVKWIKITTDMFDNRKIKHLRRLPDGNNIILIWVMLLTIAGRCNASGMIFLTENIPYTPKMLADELDFEENTVQLALTALENFNMIVKDQGYFKIAGWGEYQSVDRLAELREYNRLAKQKSRAKQKQISSVNDMSMTSQSCQDTDIDKEIDKDIEGEREKEDKKDKKDIIPDKIDKSDFSPFKPSGLTSELIKGGYISENDIYIDQYNEILKEISDSYSFEIARSCLWYFIKRFKAQPTDENGNEIFNKVAYFKTAMNDGAKRLNSDNAMELIETCGVGSWLYS